MIHGRADYQRIQDPEGKIPEDEPVFLIRGQDYLAIPTLSNYLSLATLAGASEEFKTLFYEHLGRFEKWQEDHIDRVKVPDLPGEQPEVP